jgi:hypothetical protein
MKKKRKRDAPTWKIASITTLPGRRQDRHRFSVALSLGDEPAMNVSMKANDLLDYTAFQAAVLAETGRLVRLPKIEKAKHPQAAWLDLIEKTPPEEPPKAEGQSVFGD